MKPHALTCPRFVSPHAFCNCGQHMPTRDSFKLQVDTTITPEGNIVSEVNSVGTQYRNNVTRQIIQAQEEGVKQALKKLGWMSPHDVEQIIWICDKLLGPTIAKEDFERTANSAFQNIKSLCEGK